LVLTKTEAKSGYMASVLTIIEAKGPAKFFYLKKILNTYGFGSSRPEAENILYGLG